MSFSAGISAIPGLAATGSLYRQADAALFWGKRHGRTCVTIYDPERHDQPDQRERPQAELSALVARVAATGAVRAVFQPIYDLTTGAPRGYEGLVRPLPDSGFTDPGSMFEAAEATGRTGELDMACLNTVMETAAGLRLPGQLTVNLSPRTSRCDDFSVHALLRMIVRHGLDPRRIVLELTEREAVEDIDRLRRTVEACRVAGHPPRGRRRRRRQRRAAAPEPAPVRHRQDRPVAGPGRAPSTTRRSRSLRTLRDLADRWGALGRRRGHRDAAPSSTSSARSGSGPARATCSAGRPTGPRPTRSTSTASAGAPTG